MNVSDLFDYLITLERKEFTGSITLNFHNGDVSSKVTKKIKEKVKE